MRLLSGRKALNQGHLAVPLAILHHIHDQHGMARVAALNQKISRLYFAFNEARQRCLRDARSLQVPTLLLQGMSDKMVDPKEC